jgi:tryptophan synthase beta chain
MSILVKNSIIKPAAATQRDVFEAGKTFSRCEGIVPAPESAHAVYMAMEIAKMCREKNEKKVILFNLSGHGLLDLGGYGEYLSGALPDNCEPKSFAFEDLPMMI